MITDFLTLDPLVAALLLTAFSVVVLALGRFAWRRWRAHEDAKRRSEQRLKAQMGPVVYPPKPFGSHHQPWRDRRKDIA